MNNLPISIANLHQGIVNLVYHSYPPYPGDSLSLVIVIVSRRYFIDELL